MLEQSKMPMVIKNLVGEAAGKKAQNLCSTAYIRLSLMTVILMVLCSTSLHHSITHFACKKKQIKLLLKRNSELKKSLSLMIYQIIKSNEFNARHNALQKRIDQ